MSSHLNKSLQKHLLIWPIKNRFKNILSLKPYKIYKFIRFSFAKELRVIFLPKVLLYIKNRLHSQRVILWEYCQITEINSLFTISPSSRRKRGFFIIWYLFRITFFCIKIELPYPGFSLIVIQGFHQIVLPAS